jgi:hypothetical protein
MVEVIYFESGIVAEDGFFWDIEDALEEARLAGDRRARDTLRRLWLDFIEVQLPAMGADKLIAFLESRQIWREDGAWLVLKTVDEPCISYTARVNANGSVTLIALGACYRYPQGNDEGWWLNVVRPRLRSL